MGSGGAAFSRTVVRDVRVQSGCLCAFDVAENICKQKVMQKCRQQSTVNSQQSQSTAVSTMAKRSRSAVVDLTGGSSDENDGDIQALTHHGAMPPAKRRRRGKFDKESSLLMDRKPSSSDDTASDANDDSDVELIEIPPTTDPGGSRMIVAMIVVTTALLNHPVSNAGGSRIIVNTPTSMAAASMTMTKRRATGQWL